MDTKRFLVGLCLCFILMAIFVPGCGRGDDFSSKLEYLQTRDAGESGVPALIDGYEGFIAQYRSDPRVARAMFDLGSVYESTWAGQDYDKALWWFDSAAKTATPNTDIWKKANFYVFNRLLYNPHRDLPRTEKILLDMKRHLQNGDIVFSMEIEQKYADFYGVQGLLDEAERHCGNVLSVYRDGAGVAKNELDKSRIDNLIGVASGNMVAYILNAVNMPAGERLRRLKRLGGKYTLITQYNSYQRAVEQLDPTRRGRRS